MIQFLGVTKTWSAAKGSVDVLRDFSAEFDTAAGNLAILGRSGSGKTTLINLISGMTLPTSGKVIRHTRVSWPMGWRGFGGTLTGEECIGLLSMLYGADRRALLNYSVEVSGLGARVFEPMKKLRPQEKSRLVMAAAYALDFDNYLLDGQMPQVGEECAARFRGLWEQKLHEQRVIMVTSRPAELTEHFPQAAIFGKGTLSERMPAPAAAMEFRKLARQEAVSSST